mmetsp:Transcript_36271/g.26398  ORF Transcript_36271/g.26398 Transcript_36271/m.26398 type:complete len:141 (+) Transcript_36271:407-829(+)
MCFNLGIPLVESGTNGYKATCISICKGYTQCYQCIEREKDQSFPVCTIRQRPEKIIHCIVWAKALYEGLYGPKDKTSSNIIEDILEELELARKSENQVRFAEILFDRMFNSEPGNLKKSLKDRMTHAKENNEEVEDAEET